MTRASMRIPSTSEHGKYCSWKVPSLGITVICAKPGVTARHVPARTVVADGETRTVPGYLMTLCVEHQRAYDAGELG